MQSIPDPLFAARVKLEVERRLFGAAAARLKVGRFEVMDRLGAGAMSIVYAAHDPELGRSVALKLLQDGEGSERLIREARALARLRHPNVVSVYDVGRWGEHLFIALEHVEGVTLAEWLRAASRSWREIVRVLSEVAAGLAAVHEAGLTHRDVKPDNIVVDANGAARVVDFGLVGASDEPDRDATAHRPLAPNSRDPLTRPGGTPGTPRYMAPERLRGEPATPASDQFSFAVTLEEALEGVDVPGRIREIARRGLAPSAADRFPTMRAMRAALQREPRLKRAWPILAAVAVASAAGIAAWSRSSPVAVCSAGDDIVAQRWSPARRAEVARQLPGADAALRALDEYARRQNSARRELCLAEGRPVPPPSETRVALRVCLDGRLAAFGDAIRTLATANAAMAARADDVVAELPPIEECRIVESEGEPIAGVDPSIYLEFVQGASKEGARTTMQAGLRALRDGERDGAARSFEEAARIDGQYAAPHLWLALVKSHGYLIDARASFAKAFALRAGLGAANRVLLSALVPCVQADPIDDLECESRLARAATASPRNAHLWFELARHRWNREGSSQAVVDAFDRALRADPKFVMPRFAKGQALAYLGRFDEALVTVDECLRMVPGATACLHDRIWINAHRGDCAAVQADARRWQAAAPADTLAYAYLASTALARGDPLDTVAELLRQGSDRAPEAERAFFRARDRTLLAVMDGDFAAALRDVEALEATLAHLPDRASRLLAPRIRIFIALETGDRREAGRLAAEALRKKDAWTPDPRTEDFAIAKDFVPTLHDVLRDTGAITDAKHQELRGAWLLEWRARSSKAWYPFLWLAAYARNVDDEAGAIEAAAAMPEYGRPPFHPLSYPDRGLGLMYLLTGHAEQAVPFLERAAWTCHAGEYGFGIEVSWDAVRAARDLGRALETTGRLEAACASYRRVLERWGHAKPRSVTADDARARLARLACAPR